ncbi:MAG: chloride channel protein [Rhodobacteraceae bacterium]|nr:chloride channel protein [Paracoccaceae bacterium]
MADSELPGECGGRGTLAPRSFAILIAVALVIGSVTSFAALAFIEGYLWISQILQVTAIKSGQFGGSAMTGWSVTIAVTTIGGIAVGTLLSRYTIQGKPHGPPDVIAAVALRRSFVSFRSGLASTLAAMLALGTGAPVGLYGPLVFMGALVGNIASRLRIDFPGLPSIAVGCGVAAAVSTAFHAPIAGLIFTHEVIHRHYSLRSFAPTVIASITGYLFANKLFDKEPLLAVTFEEIGNRHEYLLLIALGCCAGLLAVGFQKLVHTAARIGSRIPWRLEFRTGLAGLVVGITAIWIPQVLGPGTELMRAATIAESFGELDLVLLLAAKILLCTICLGFGFAGGIFGPSLVIGALFGAVFWSLVDTWLPLSNSGLLPYVISGLVAVAAPVVGAPLTIIVFVFELTHNYDITIYATISTIASILIGNQLLGQSYFERQLSQSGIDLESGREKAVLTAARVLDYASAETPRCSGGESVTGLFFHPSRQGLNEILVVDPNDRLLGRIHRADIIGKSGTAADLAEEVVLVFNQSTSLFDAAQSVSSCSGEILPIVDSADGTLIGAATKENIIAAYLKISRELQEESHAH